MKAFFEGIQYLFVNILFTPLDFLKTLVIIRIFYTFVTVNIILV